MACPAARVQRTTYNSNGQHQPCRNFGHAHWEATKQVTATSACPTRVSHTRRSAAHWRAIHLRMRAPARLTNLSALILSLLALSILLNLRSRYGSVAYPLLHFRSIEDTLLKRPTPSSVLGHVVIVPGHAIWIGATADDAEEDDVWLLYPFQKGRGRPSLYRAHIARR